MNNDNNDDGKKYDLLQDDSDWKFNSIDSYSLLNNSLYHKIQIKIVFYSYSSTQLRT